MDFKESYCSYYGKKAELQYVLKAESNLKLYF